MSFYNLHKIFLSLSVTGCYVFLMVWTNQDQWTGTWPCACCWRGLSVTSVSVEGLRQVARLVNTCFVLGQVHTTSFCQFYLIRKVWRHKTKIYGIGNAILELNTKANAVKAQGRVHFFVLNIFQLTISWNQYVFKAVTPTLFHCIETIIRLRLGIKIFLRICPLGLLFRLSTLQPLLRIF